MKKTLALFAVAAMMFTTGCGNKAAEEVQQSATEAVDQVKDKADEAATAATDAVNNAANTAANTVQAAIDDAKDVMSQLASGTAAKSVPALDGVVPGINVEVITEKYGEPVATENQVMQFSNGLDMKVANNVVEEVSTVYDGLYTPAQIAVGMVDYSLNDAYGDATSVKTEDNGDVVYSYVNNNRTISFTTHDGYISEIKCSLNK